MGKKYKFSLFNPNQVEKLDGCREGNGKDMEKIILPPSNFFNKKRI